MLRQGRDGVAGSSKALGLGQAIENTFLAKASPSEVCMGGGQALTKPQPPAHGVFSLGPLCG